MVSSSTKFKIRCVSCGVHLHTFRQWLDQGQCCYECKSQQAEVVYEKYTEQIERLMETKGLPGLWHYYDILPLNNRANIISGGEGSVSVDRWRFLEKFAKRRYQIDCKVYAHRQDNNGATGTFKDLAGSVVASVLKENNIKNYVVATTGNIGVAYARYLTHAGITLFVFLPENASRSQEAEIGCFGQKVFRVKGDYSQAKKVATQFSQKYGILRAAGNLDLMRIEAKKTMFYEYIRLMQERPTVYIQALSGGTGPLGIIKACKELRGTNLLETIPRLILVQTDKCPPMAEAWSNAKKSRFPQGWEKNYPVIDNPETSIPTLATGRPKTYPIISKLVRDTDGEIIAFPESNAVDVARLVAFESAVRIGPAAAIAVGGFLMSLNRGFIRNGDVVVTNIGEGIRRSPEFMEKLIYTTTNISSVDDCDIVKREDYRRQVWAAIQNMVS